MNLRETIAAYTNAASAQDYYDDRGDAQRADAAAEHLRHWQRVIDVQLAVAEAAMAYAEFNVNAGWETGMDGASYIRERGKLLDAFIEARAKDEGERVGQ